MQPIKEIILKVKNRALVNSVRQITLFLKVNFIIMKFTVREHIIGVMVDNIQAIGRIMLCLVKENMHGQMEELIMEDI